MEALPLATGLCAICICGERIIFRLVNLNYGHTSRADKAQKPRHHILLYHSQVHTAACAQHMHLCCCSALLSFSAVIVIMPQPSFPPSCL